METNFLKFKITRTLVLLYSLLALSTALLVYAVLSVNSITYRQALNYDGHIRFLVAHDNFRQGTDLLSAAVRRYVVTGNPEFMDHYFEEAEVEKHRDRALKDVAQLDIDPALKYTLTNAMKTSRKLMHAEYKAMHLVSLDNERAHDSLHRHPEVGNAPLTDEEKHMSRERRRDIAMHLLWDDAYIQSKVEIYDYLDTGIAKASLQAMTRHLGLKRKLLHMLVLAAASLISLVLTACGLILYRRRQRERMIELQSAENARMNQQLKMERDKTLKAEKAKSYFFSTVSHDIRTPLNSIIGFSEMLQLGIDDPEEREKALDAIITSGHTLLELINDVLDLSKLESGKMELHPVPTDVAALIDKVANSFNVATSRTSVPLRTEVAKMPFLKLDPQRIRQVLFNLIGNAVKFTAKGAITVRASYEGGTFTLSVSDTGCGISEENIKKLMSPYVQLQEHDSTKGTGLGLAICKQLATQMKGTLELDSALGEGSTFTLRIPNVEAFTEKESEAYFSEHRSSHTETTLHEGIYEKTILVVDDQQLNRRILQTMLARLGIRNVLTAENGKDALETLERVGNADIVLTDMTMPVMDGAALVREIRKSPRFARIPVYVITADVEMQSQYKDLGVDELLIKPMTLEKLKELLAKYAPHRTPETDAGNGGAKA